MKKIILLLSFSFYVLAAFSQQTLPAYVDVLKEFCKYYTPKSEYEDYTSFAKKKNGWYVQQTDRTKEDKLLSEQLFYSVEQKNYIALDKFYDKAENPDLDNLLNKFLLVNGGTADWYCFERIPYYGYTGWFVDLINDYSNKENLTDKELDGLGRAYDNLASTFLWYQNGGLFPGDDTLHRKLGRLEYPSKQRISKLKEALDNGIVQFEKLSKLNPGYHTIVGNGVLKLFNEYMHAYNQFIMCNADELANEYLQKATLDNKYIAQAKNYLNSCEQNAVLISYGDNDTYQLWYVQEKFNYRKDVTVINNSLLGMPVYIDMLKRKKMIVINTPAIFLKSSTSDVAYYQENKKILPAGQPMPLTDLLKIVYTKKYPSSFEAGAFATFPVKKIVLPLANPTGKKIVFNLTTNYLLLNDIVTYDIVVNNISNRPVYFTSQYGNIFQNNLLQKGVIYKLTADNINLAAIKASEAAGLEKYFVDKYVPVTSSGNSFISIDGDNTFFGLYTKLITYYREKKDEVTSKKWVKRLQQAMPELNQFQMLWASPIAMLCLQNGYKDYGLKLINDYALWLQNAVNNPSALNGYYSSQSFLSTVKSLQKILDSYSMTSSTINKLIENAE